MCRVIPSGHLKEVNGILFHRSCYPIPKPLGLADYVCLEPNKILLDKVT
jgi:hypothetical protein